MPPDPGFQKTILATCDIQMGATSYLNLKFRRGLDLTSLSSCHSCATANDELRRKKKKLCILITLFPCSPLFYYVSFFLSLAFQHYGLDILPPAQLILNSGGRILDLQLLLGKQRRPLATAPQHRNSEREKQTWSHHFIRHCEFKLPFRTRQNLSTLNIDICWADTNFEHRCWQISQYTSTHHGGPKASR